MRQRRAEKGFSLIEALVAMLVISIAVAGAVRIVSDANIRAASEAQRLEAWNELRYRVRMAAPSEGQLTLSPSSARAQWRVSRELAHSGHLAGVPVEWLSIRGEIRWTWRGEERFLEYEEIRMSAASHS